MKDDSATSQILDVDNVKERLDAIHKGINEINQEISELTIDYINKICGVFPIEENDPFLLLRESIIFRLSSTMFHLNLLLKIQDDHIKILREKPIDSNRRSWLLLNGADQQVYIFDSIIFHAVSIFDYLGNIIDYLCIGKGQRGLQWGGIAKSAHHKKNVFSKYPIASVIVQFHKSFIEQLYNHRSDLIHFKTDRGGARTSLDIMKGNSNFIVFAPHRFCKKFPPLRVLADYKKISIKYSSFWVCDQTISAMTELLRSTRDHVDKHRKTPPNFMILFKDIPKK